MSEPKIKLIESSDVDPNFCTKSNTSYEVQRTEKTEEGTHTVHGYGKSPDEAYKDMERNSNG